MAERNPQSDGAKHPASNLPPAELLDRANQLAEEGHLEQALDLYATVQRELDDPDEIVTVLLSEINCLSDLGRTKEARSKLKKAMELLPSDSPNFSHVQVAEARILIAEGNREEALRSLSQLASNKAKLLQAENGTGLYQSIQVWRTWTLLDEHRYQEARPILDEVLTLGIEDSTVQYYAGVCYFGVAEYKLAKEHYETALRMGLAPLWEWQARVHLGPIYYAEGALAKAKLEYERAETLGHQIHPLAQDRKNVYLWLAKISRELGESDESDRYEKLARESTK